MTTKTSLIGIAFCLASLTSSIGHSAPEMAKLKVACTLPEFAEMAEAIGGDALEVTSLLKGIEDPHMVDTTPALILKLMKSDLIVSAGLSLESAWLNRAIAKTSRPALQHGGPGNVELGEFVDVLERPLGKTDRSQGDVHSDGNPHFNLSPQAMASASRGLLKTLILLRPALKEKFELGQKTFESEMKDVETETREILKSASDLKVMEYHREFVYFFALYGLRSAGSIEAKPGLAPSSGRLAEVASLARSGKIVIAIGGTFAPRQHLRRFTELSGVPHAIVPTTVRPKSDDAGSIRLVQKTIARAIAERGPTRTAAE